ncbi:MAG: hypothetical protein HN341_08335 [Verrucomicrobia bacterium]|jgi:hypothetical protein|nr:hypothetical protein [Verrucomicrobiota bacterium]
MKTLMTAIVAGAVFTIAGNAMAGKGCPSCSASKTKATEVKVQTTCPVMGGKINKAQYADVKGKRIYVCCPGCIGKITSDPDTYIKKLEKEGVTLDETPKTTKKKLQQGSQ